MFATSTREGKKIPSGMREKEGCDVKRAKKFPEIG